MKEQKFGKCLRCGRLLKSPIAKKLGYGPLCYKRIHNHIRKKNLIDTGVCDDGKATAIGYR